MDNRIRRSLGGYPLRIKWKTQGGLDEVSELASKLDLDWDESELMENFYKPMAELMFEFDKAPPKQFWEDYKSFPIGEFEVLQSFFISPTKAI